MNASLSQNGRLAWIRSVVVAWMSCLRDSQSENRVGHALTHCRGHSQLNGYIRRFLFRRDFV